MRRSLPNRRECETFRFTHGGMRYFGTIGYYPGLAPGEIFLCGPKAGTEIEAVARDAAVLASRALQHGDTIDGMRESLTRLDDARPAGPIGTFFDMLALKRPAAQLYLIGPSVSPHGDGGRRTKPETGDAMERADTGIVAKSSDPADDFPELPKCLDRRTPHA